MRNSVITIIAVLVLVGLTAAATGATYSIWAPGDTPAVGSSGDLLSVTVGVKFESSISGFVTAVRYYKGPFTIGTHIGSVWTESGTLLGNVTFSGETSEGWQEQALATPVAIDAGTTYVVSCFAPSGDYAIDAGYFATSGKTNAPLVAFATTEVTGGNGVYSYNVANTFPSVAFGGANYWVDLVLDDAPPPPPPTPPSTSPVDRGFVEGFDALEATYSWLEWSDEWFYFPWWEQTTNGLFVYSTFEYATFLYAKDDSSEGRLSGNFVAAGVAGMEADVYADWPEEIDNLYLYLYSNTESNLYSYGPFTVTTDWTHISASLDATNWEISDGLVVTTGTVPDAALTNVTEVGIYAESVGDLDYPTIVNLDNFGLIAAKVPPELDIRLLDDPDTTEVLWEGLKGQTYTLQYVGDLLGTPVWTNVPGAVDLVGFGLDLAVTNLETALLEFYRATTDTNSYTYLLPTGMQTVPGGTSFIGDQWAEGDADELPQHSVLLSTYFMDHREVTNMKMADVLTWALASGKISATTDTVTNVEGTPYELVDLDHPECQISYLPTENIFEVVPDKELFPCVAVTWYGAQAFCNYLSDIEGRDRCINFADWSCDFSQNGYRLPTEAEWEKGARGGFNYNHYPWSSFGPGYASFIDGSDANYDGSGDPAEGAGDPETMPTASYPFNAYGVFDAAGNVSEWVWDWYDATAYSHPNAGSLNWTGPASGTTRVMRGGSWADGVVELRCAARNDAGPTTAAGDVGFRAVLREP